VPASALICPCRATCAYWHRSDSDERKDMTLNDDNVLIVVDDPSPKAFFSNWASSVRSRTTARALWSQMIWPRMSRGWWWWSPPLAMIRTPDGAVVIELYSFHKHRSSGLVPYYAPLKRGYPSRHVRPRDYIASSSRACAHGPAHRRNEYEDTYRLAYIRGPEGSQLSRLGPKSARLRLPGLLTIGALQRTRPRITVAIRVFIAVSSLSLSAYDGSL